MTIKKPHSLRPQWSGNTVSSGLRRIGSGATLTFTLPYAGATRIRFKGLPVFQALSLIRADTPSNDSTLNKALPPSQIRLPRTMGSGKNDGGKYLTPLAVAGGLEPATAKRKRRLPAAKFTITARRYRHVDCRCLRSRLRLCRQDSRTLAARGRNRRRTGYPC